MSVFSKLVDPKIVAVLSILNNAPDEYFHLHKLSSQAKVSLASIFRIVNRLVKLKLIECITVGKFKIYRAKEPMSKTISLVNPQLKKIISTLSGGEHFHIQKLSSRSGVPLGTTFRMVNFLVNLNLVSIITIGKFKIYEIKSQELISVFGEKK